MTIGHLKAGNSGFTITAALSNEEICGSTINLPVQIVSITEHMCGLRLSFRSGQVVSGLSLRQKKVCQLSSSSDYPVCERVCSLAWNPVKMYCST